MEKVPECTYFMRIACKSLPCPTLASYEVSVTLCEPLGLRPEKMDTMRKPHVEMQEAVKATPRVTIK